MTDKTEKNLAYAFAAESKAAVRNAAFAGKADREELPQIAKLFRAVSEAESIHARRFLLMMRGKIGSTEDNLETPSKATLSNQGDLLWTKIQSFIV